MTKVKKYLAPSIVILIFFILLTISIIVFAKLNQKSKDIQENTIPTGATASVVDQTTTTEDTAPSETTEDTEATTELTYSSDFITDVNLYDQSIDDFTISIDNKLITFPCSYATLKENFTLYDGQIQKSDVLFDEAVEGEINNLVLFAYPENGNGYISFTLNGSSLETCVCTKVSVLGGTYLDGKVMPIALKGGISFGSELKDVLESFADDPDSLQNVSGDTESQTIYIDSAKISRQYYCRNYILYQIIFTYEMEGET